MSGVNKKTSLAFDIAQILRGKTLMTGVALAVLQTKTAGAVSLGELRVQSALGEPLVATTIARIGPGESIAAGCISAPKTAGDLGGPDGLKISSRAGSTPGNYPVQIRTTRPLYEPIYEIRLQIDCPGGVALAKSYVVMLNLPLATPANATTRSAVTGPAESAPAGSGTSAASANAQAQAQTQAATQRPAAPARSRNATGTGGKLSSSRAPIPAGQDYRVRNGDTLSMIAQRIQGRPAGSTWQVAELLYQTNPHAFIRGNRDMIKLGAVLSIPDTAALGGASTATRDVAPMPADVRAPRPEQPALRGEPRPPVTLGRPEETATPVAPVTTASIDEATAADVSNEELLREIRAGRAATAAESAPSPFAEDASAASEASAAPAAAELPADTQDNATPAATPATSSQAQAATAQPQQDSGSNPVIAVLAGIGLGVLLALLLLGRNLLAPLLEGRARRKAALASATGRNSDDSDDGEDNDEHIETAKLRIAAARPAYGGAGIDVELSDNAAAAEEASQVAFNPFSDGDESPAEDWADTGTHDTDAQPTAATQEAPRVSLRGGDPAADQGGDLDLMLGDLEEFEETKRFETPALNAGSDGSDDSLSLDADTGTMRELFEDTAGTRLGSTDETAEMPEGEAPTVEMPDYDSPTVEMDGDEGVTAEMPAMDSSDSDAAGHVDIDISDLESLSRHLADNNHDDRLSATLTQALDLLEQDYEDEFTQSQILERREVAEAFADHKDKD